MALSIGHGVAGWAIGMAVTASWGPPRRVAFVCAVAAIVPDLDVLLRLLPDATHAILGGHRGITHSLAFATLAPAAAVALGFRPGGLPATRTWLGLSGAIGSHAFLDMLTSYGVGVALFAPFSSTLVSLPWHPIDPDTASRAATSDWGQLALAIGNEVLWVWLPALLLGLALPRRFPHSPPAPSSSAL